MPSHVKEKLGKVKIQESSENNCVLPVSQTSEHAVYLHVYDAHTCQPEPELRSLATTNH